MMPRLSNLITNSEMHNFSLQTWLPRPTKSTVSIGFLSCLSMRAAIEMAKSYTYKIGSVRWDG